MTPEHFRTLRERLGLTAEALGRIPGLRYQVTDRTVRRWEAGDVPIPDDAIAALLALDAEVERRVQATIELLNDRTLQDGAPECVDLIRYRDDEQLASAHPNFPGGTAVHNAMIGRCREAIERRGVPVRILPKEYGGKL